MSYVLFQKTNSRINSAIGEERMCLLQIFNEPMLVKEGLGPFDSHTFQIMLCLVSNSNHTASRHDVRTI